MTLHVPAGFSTDVGLAESDESRWVTTAREARMFTAAIRRAKERGDIDILSRPQVQVADEQTATLAIEGFKLAARLTPSIAPDGGTALRLEADLAEAKAVRVTAKIPDGGTLVVRGPRTKNGEILIVATVNRVAK